MVDFTVIIGNLEQLGFYDFVLPWLLFFSIIYGLLIKANLFGEESQRINALIAVVLAFFGVNYLPFGQNLGVYLSTVFGGGSIVLSVILLAVITSKLLGVELTDVFGTEKADKYGKPALVLFTIIVAYGLYIGSGSSISLDLSDDTITTIVMILIIGLAVWLVSSGGGEKGSEQQAVRLPGK